MLQELDIRDSASSSSEDESGDGVVGGVPNVLTSTTDTGSSGAESGGYGRGRGALDDEELDAMLSDLVGRRSGGGGNKALRSPISARNAAPTSVFALNDTRSNDDAQSVASSLGMSHDVDVSRISHGSRRRRNANAKASNARERNIIASLERELQASKQAVDALRRQSNERNEEATKSKLQVDSLVTEKSAIEQERNSLRADLEAMRARLAESEDIIDQQQTLIQHNESEVQLYEKRTIQIEDELEALRTERDDLHAELVAGCDEVTSSQKKTKAAEAKISALRSENAALKSDLSDKCSESKSSEDSRKAAEAEVAKLRAECSKLRSSRVAAESLKRDKEDLTASVDEKAGLIGKLKGDLAAERKQKQASRQESKALKDAKAKLQSRVKTLMEDNESFKRQLGDLQQAFADLKQDNSDAHAVLSELEDAHGALASSEKENECLVEAATELEEELSRAKEERVDMVSNISALTQESEENRASLRNLTEELTNEKSKSTSLSEELKDSKAMVAKLMNEVETIRSDKDTAETDYIQVLAQLENAKVQLADAKIDATTARNDAADGIDAFERRLREKLEVQLNEHRAAIESLQMKHEDETALLQKKYDELMASVALEKDEELSTLRTNIIDLERTLQKNMENAERKEEQMAQELNQVGGWLEKSKQREEAAATELKKLQALSEDAARQSEAAYDQRLEEELEIQRLAYEASAKTIEAQSRATMATKVRSLQEEMQSRDADGKKVINRLRSELDKARSEIDAMSAEAEEAYSRADQLELEAVTLRESLRILEKQNSALIKGRERVHLTSAATQTDSVPKELREMGSQADIAIETDDGNMHRMEESLRQTKVELAAALTASICLKKRC